MNTWIIGLTAARVVTACCVVIALAEIATAILCLRDRDYWRAALMIVCAAVLVGVAGFQVWMQGTCLLPHPSTVEFYQGMTLCPGQSAIMHMELPIPRQRPSDKPI